MFIQTNRLTLRLIEEKDKYDYYEIFSDQTTCKYLLYEPWTLTTLDEKFNDRLSHRCLSFNGCMELACLLNDKVIGNISIFSSKIKETVEIGYVFHKQFLHQGYATEALNCIIQYLFEDLKLHRIYANLDTRNIASARLCERLGMRKEAHFIQDYWYKGSWSDSYIYSMLASDYHEIKSNSQKV